MRIPSFDLRNIKLFYIFNLVHEAFFTEGNWIFFFLIFFNYQELGTIDAITLSLGIMLEIPSGAVADLIGKKKTIIFSFILLVISLAMISFAESREILFIGNLFFFSGLAFYSGAADALAYDTFVEHKREEEYPRMLAFSKTLKSLIFIVAAFIGGYVATINPRLPFMLWGAGFAISLVASFFLQEPKVDSYKFSWTQFWRQSLTGVKQLVGPKLKIYFVVILAVLGIDYLYGWGFIKPAILVDLKLDAFSMGVLFAVYGILDAVLINYLPALRKKFGNDLKLMFFFASGIILSLALLLTGNYQLGILANILMPTAGLFGSSLITIIVNENIDSSTRATVLSTVSLLIKLPFVLLMPLAGSSVMASGVKPIILTLLIIASTAVLSNWLLARKTMQQKALPQEGF